MRDQATPSSQPSGSPALPDERREVERFPPEPSSICRVVSDTQDEAARATVRDLSTTGIGLLVRQPIKPGSVLILSLEVRECRLPRPLPVRVMHAAPADEGNWLVGCQFVRRLSEPELQILQGQP
jgi:hypothetical protein